MSLPSWVGGDSLAGWGLGRKADDGSVMENAQGSGRTRREAFPIPQQWVGSGKPCSLGWLASV